MMEIEAVKVKPRIPWPGPRPYDEHEWRDYFGRGREIEDLVDRVRAERLTVLLGASGSGKTSLIRAGVVANLRNLRYRGGEKSVWPVLLLRRWGAKRDSSMEGNLFRQLEKAIEPIETWRSRRGHEQASEDARIMRLIVKRKIDGVLPKLGFVQLVESMTNEQAGREHEGGPEAGVILVFDQFEELLRSNERSRLEIIRIIGDLFESRAPIKVLLSMRQEYRQSLRELEGIIGGLRDRSVHLEELDLPSVREVLGGVSKSGEFAIDSGVTDIIMEWLHETQEEAARSGAEQGEGEAEVGSSGVDHVVGRPDLLRLQAVLVDLCRFAVEVGAKRISEDVLEEFVLARHGERIAASAGLEDPGHEERFGGLASSAGNKAMREVFDSALERWIESSIANDDSESASIYANHSKLEALDLELQVRRVAVRLAPLLSSADYKVSQEENVLLRQSLGEDIAKLLVENSGRVSELSIIEAEDSHELRFDWDGIGGVKEVIKKERQLLLSGRARVGGWSLEQTGDRILACFKEALARLVKNNILQRTTLGDQEEKVYWELVHDQLGPHFSRWAATQKGTWDDCKSSLVVLRGIQPIAVQKNVTGQKNGEGYDELRGISWQGCSVANVFRKRVVFRHVRFADCFLRGTIFERIDFVACEFERCDLIGALFTGCNFRVDDRGKATTFRECHSNVAIVGGFVEGLQFSDCQLNQPAIKDVFLGGDIAYNEGSKVVQGLFEKIKQLPDKKAQIIVSSDSKAAYCFVRSEIEKSSLFVVARENPNLPNNVLPDEFRTVTD